MRILHLFLLLLLSGCGFNNFGDINPSVSVIEANTDICDLRDLVSNGPIRYDYVVRGVVTSSDSSGNFYKQLYIEDSSGAIELRLGVYDLFSLYKRWDVVSVRLSMISIGTYFNTLQYGYGRRGSDYVDPIMSYDIIEDLVVYQGERVDNFGSAVSLVDLDTDMAGRLVLVGGQFLNGGAVGGVGEFEGKQPFGDGDRVVIVSTSSYAGFSKSRLPVGFVTLRAIVTFDSKNNVELKLSDLSDVLPFF